MAEIEARRNEPGMKQIFEAREGVENGFEKLLKAEFKVLKTSRARVSTRQELAQVLQETATMVGDV
jgi:hypothetical protein